MVVFCVKIEGLFSRQIIKTNYKILRFDGIFSKPRFCVKIEKKISRQIIWKTKLQKTLRFDGFFSKPRFYEKIEGFFFSSNHMKK